MPKFGTLIRSYREQRKLSQTDLAKAAGISQPQVAQVENSRTSPNIDVALILCHVLQVPLRELSKLYTKECELADKRLKKIRGAK